VSDYRDGDYLARSIAGAFTWLDGLDKACSPEHEPPDLRRRDAARAAFRLMRRGIPSDELLIILHQFNEDQSNPLTRDDIDATVLWAARRLRDRTNAR
jgi:hypothetical protein